MLAWFVGLSLFAGRAVAVEPMYDVLVYGGTPAGIAAAIAAADTGHSVALVEPYRNIGGLVTNGLTHPDFRTFESLTGVFLDFCQRVQDYYGEKYGCESPQFRDSLRGLNAEPSVNLIVFEQMLAEQPLITVMKQTSVRSVRKDDATKRITSAEFMREGTPIKIAADVFIDASYEGDLMAAAGVEYRIGREASSEYSESLAPEAADAQVQGYSFRLTMTPDPQRRVKISQPPGYRREDFVALLPMLESGQFKTVFCDKTGGVVKAHLPPLPNAKHDMNDVSRGLVRLSMPGVNYDWPDHPETRTRIFAEHVRHNLGILYFLQNDPAVPAKFAEEARQWGLCNDEFPDTAHLPEQLYVREARRMVGRIVFTERDTDPAPGDARSVLRNDAIAIGDYSPNCHGTSHVGPLIGGHHEGEFYKSVAPYQIAYGVLLPKDIDNLLVPVACSASHVGFCALRLEPIWTSLGQAAGLAAHFAIDEEVSVPSVNVQDLQRLLHEKRSATIYTSDVPPNSLDFLAVQWWGTLGGWHGVSPSPKKPGERGKFIVGQYYEAFPGHAVELGKDLDPQLRRQWMAIATSAGLDTKSLSEAQTRGDFVRQAFEQR
jgi:hypothetical protein